MNTRCRIQKIRSRYFNFYPRNLTRTMEKWIATLRCSYTHIPCTETIETKLFKHETLQILSTLKVWQCQTKYRNPICGDRTEWFEREWMKINFLISLSLRQMHGTLCSFYFPTRSFTSMITFKFATYSRLIGVFNIELQNNSILCGSLTLSWRCHSSSDKSRHFSKQERILGPTYFILDQNILIVIYMV